MSTSTRTERNLTETELGAWGGMLRVYLQVTRLLDNQLVAVHDLTTSDYEVLMFLAHAPDRRLRMSEISESVLISQSGITRLVDRLERRGWLGRETCTDDRRGQYAVLTDLGYAKLREASVTHVAGIRKLFLQHLSESERESMGAMWEQIAPGTADAINVTLR